VQYGTLLREPRRALHARYALTKQQASLNDPIQSWPQLLLGLAHYSGQQSVIELASYRRSDLRDLFGGAKPVEPRH
jgi:hypothetical protein